MAHIKDARKYAFYAILILTLAGAVGSLLRFALAYGMPAGWGEFANIRHAHSHTMFGWTILALMSIIWHRLPLYTGKPLPAGVRWQMAAATIFSLLQLAAFWPNGYGLTRIGSATMPLGAMSAGFAGLTWFWFMALYWKTTRHIRPRPLPLRLWDWAVVLLLLASLGAMSEPALLGMHIENNFIKHLFLHLFLDIFTSGWLLLAILGVIWARLSVQKAPVVWLPVASLALFSIPTFLLGMSPDLISPWMFWVASLSHLVASGLIAVHLWRLLQRHAELPLLVKFGLLGLLVQVVAGVIMLSPGIWAWGAGMLRIFYLHDMLLLWSSSALLGLLLAEFGNRFGVWRKWSDMLWMIGVGLMWLALLGGGFLQWLPVSGKALLVVAAWSSAIIVLAAAMMLKCFVPWAPSEK
ncbi:MAG: hypothetical protein DSY55_03830 [Clostridia bacterium]|nr:MAG: hypothetical protein DSY55_03830 [Clostridia bacterium]